uniref:Uncharacterized protein n=1 Tax=Octopus bimaculoides TaxID=37653 RepID=A0A0L8H5Y0_OCTBM
MTTLYLYLKPMIFMFMEFFTKKLHFGLTKLFVLLFSSLKPYFFLLFLEQNIKKNNIKRISFVCNK